MTGWVFTGGLPETRCGYGSTLKGSESVRAKFPLMCAQLGIKSIVDAPCGDGNWISQMIGQMEGIKYRGFDIDPDNVAAAQAKGLASMAPYDILRGLMPTADLLLCRDFIQHLPNWAIIRFFHLHLRRYKYLAITSHDNDVNEDLETDGEFRPVNLTKPPFMWRGPIVSIDDGPGRILGIWSLA